MPEVGGKRLAGGLTSSLAGLRKMMETTQVSIAAAVKELQIEISRGDTVVKAIQDETRAVKAAYDEVLGNDPPAGERTPPPSGASTQSASTPETPTAKSGNATQG